MVRRRFHTYYLERNEVLITTFDPSVHLTRVANGTG